MRDRQRCSRAGLTAALLLLAGTGALGCRSAAGWLVMPFLYDRADLPAGQVLRDLAYRDGPESHPQKHRLDLFLPRLPSGGGEPWPVLVFVHGGGWTSGDRGLRFAGRDVYGNIGRYFAARGIGTAVVSYRLQFEATWEDQVEDVARAVAWVHAHAERYGADPEAIFVSGHSAGGQLAARVALDRTLAARVGAPAPCGLVAVSGAGFDLADEETYELGASRRYYERRFRNGDPGDAWTRFASPIRYATPDAPPALVLYAEDDWPSLHRQAALLHEALRRQDVPSRLLEVPGEDHYTVVLALSRDEGPAAPAILEFIREREPAC